VTGTTRILLVEPDPWRSGSLEAFLRKERYGVIREEKGANPEIVLVNLCTAPDEVRRRIEHLREAFPSARILAFVPEVETGVIFPCLMLGVKGVLSFDASPEEINAAVKCLLDGSIWAPRSVLAQWIERIATLGLRAGTDAMFTPSEQRVLMGIRDEISNKEIASRLGVTEATVKFHVGKLLKKTGTHDRRQLARFLRDTESNPFQGGD